MNIQQEIKGYLHYCQYQKKLSTKSLKAYSIDLKQFLQYLSATQEQCLTKSILSGYIMRLHQIYLPRTAKRKLASLRAFLNHLEFEEVLEVNPIRKVRTKFQEPKELPKTISLKAIEKLLAVAHQEKGLAKTQWGMVVALRNAAMIETLFATGMRISELCTLTAESVDLDDGIIRITGKGAKERIIQIGNSEVLKILRQYADCNHLCIQQSGFFFVNRLGSYVSEQSVRCILNNFRQRAGISFHITPHMFRHSFATFLLEEDVDIRYIQKMLGHSSIKTTQIYTQVALEKQKAILTMKHPRNKINVG